MLLHITNRILSTGDTFHPLMSEFGPWNAPKPLEYVSGGYPSEVCLIPCLVQHATRFCTLALTDFHRFSWKLSNPTVHMAFSVPLAHANLEEHSLTPFYYATQIVAFNLEASPSRFQDTHNEAWRQYKFEVNLDIMWRPY
jgi:hypothetical protein